MSGVLTKLSFFPGVSDQLGVSLPCMITEGGSVCVWFLLSELRALDDWEQFFLILRQGIFHEHMQTNSKRPPQSKLFLERAYH